MNYNEITGALQVLAAIPQNSEDGNYEKILPAAFAYADGRIYRELNFLATDIYMFQPLIANAREVALSPDVLTVRSVSVLTPAGDATNNSRRHHLERITPEALDMFWPQSSFKRGLPKKFTVAGVRTAHALLPNPNPPTTQPLPPIFQPERFNYFLRVMPTPDRAYTAEVYGGVQPLPLSQNNPETYLSLQYAELFIACCMVFITGYQRDYGAQADDPQRAVSWEGQYTKLRDGVVLETAMQRSEGPSWTALSPAPVANQPRAP